MITGSVKLTNKFGLGTAFVLDHLGRTVAATGEAITETTKAGMTPGHFLDTQLSQDTTVYSQTGKMSGAVQIPTEYAAYPEFGTSRMAPRPVLTPAIQQHWPATLHKKWDDPALPAAPAVTGLVPPVSRP